MPAPGRARSSSRAPCAASLEHRRPPAPDRAPLPLDDLGVAEERAPQSGSPRPRRSAARVRSPRAAAGSRPAPACRAGSWRARDELLDAVAPTRSSSRRDEEARSARVALAAGAAAQLAVDAAALVAVGADHVQPAERARPRRGRASSWPPSRMSVPRPAMLVEIVTAPGAPGRRDHGRLALVVLRVQHHAGHARARRARRPAPPTRRRSRCPRAPAGRVAWTRARSRATSAARFASLWREDDVRQVRADRGRWRRDDDRAQAVEARASSSAAALRRRRHPGEPRVEAEEVLQRDRAEDAALAASGAGPPWPRPRPAGRPASAAAPRRARSTRRRARPGRRARCSRRRAAAGARRAGRGAAARAATAFSSACRAPQPSAASTRAAPASVSAMLWACSSVSKSIAGLERAHEAGEPLRPGERVARLAGDHERDARLVDQDRVGLVDEREVAAALHPLVGLEARGRRAGGRSRPPWRSGR